MVLCTVTGFAQSGKPPVISMKEFTSVKTWALDITWQAEDSFENGDFQAKLKLTATARFYLKRLDRKDAWGRWEGQKAHSANLSYTAHLLDKRNGQRLDYKGGLEAPLMAVANFQVGGETPGYQMVCHLMFPAQVTGSGMGSMLSPLTLLTTEMGQKPRFCAGPLPASGTTISGSSVNIADVPPFGTSAAPKTRVGIQYVLQPVIELAPLKPVKGKRTG
jgi:hypothetical protein